MDGGASCCENKSAIDKQSNIVNAPSVASISIPSPYSSMPLNLRWIALKAQGIFIPLLLVVLLQEGPQGMAKGAGTKWMASVGRNKCLVLSSLGGITVLVRLLLVLLVVIGVIVATGKLDNCTD